MNIIDQVNLCTLLMKRLDEAVKKRDHDLKSGHNGWIGYTLAESEGAGKYQIKADMRGYMSDGQRNQEG